MSARGTASLQKGETRPRRLLQGCGRSKHTRAGFRKSAEG